MPHASLNTEKFVTHLRAEHMNWIETSLALTDAFRSIFGDAPPSQVEEKIQSLTTQEKYFLRQFVKEACGMLQKAAEGFFLIKKNHKLLGNLKALTTAKMHLEKITSYLDELPNTEVAKARGYILPSEVGDQAEVPSEDIAERFLAYSFVTATLHNLRTQRINIKTVNSLEELQMNVWDIPMHGEEEYKVLRRLWRNTNQLVSNEQPPKNYSWELKRLWIFYSAIAADSKKLTDSSKKTIVTNLDRLENML